MNKWAKILSGNQPCQCSVKMTFESLLSHNAEIWWGITSTDWYVCQQHMVMCQHQPWCWRWRKSWSKMIEVEELCETLVLNSTLTWLTVQEDFSELIALFCILSSQRSLHQCWVVTSQQMTSTSWQALVIRRQPFMKLSIDSSGELTLGDVSLQNAFSYTDFILTWNFGDHVNERLL